MIQINLHHLITAANLCWLACDCSVFIMECDSLIAFLADTRTSWVLIWGCVLYIGLQIFTLWQKFQVRERMILMAYYIRSFMLY